jgi:hypothetical protein
LKTTQQILDKYIGSVTPGDRFALCNFSGGSTEMIRFLNSMPRTWRLITSQLVTNGIGSPAALFEIVPEAV